MNIVGITFTASAANSLAIQTDIHTDVQQKYVEHASRAMNCATDAVNVVPTTVTIHLVRIARWDEVSAGIPIAQAA